MTDDTPFPTPPTAGTVEAPATHELRRAAWRACAHPLRTLDPDDEDWSDLAPLGAAIGDARIVCIGESTHGNREFYLLKDRLFRYLATEHGFTALVLESGFPEGWQVDDWVQGGPGDLDELSRTSITSGLGDCDELRDQLRWMRERNRTSDRKLRFYGADLGGSNVDPGPSVRACLSRLPATSDDARLAATVELGPQNEALAQWHVMSSSRRASIDDAVACVVARAEASGDDLARRFAASASLICSVFGQVARGEPFAPDENLRDASMAESVRWILGREDRIVIAAHNAHLQRNGIGTMPSLGSFLSDGSFPRSVVIGATSGSGEVLEIEVRGYRFVAASAGTVQPAPDGIELLLAASCGGSSMFDLHALPSEWRPRTMPMLAQNQAHPLDVAGAFDLIVNIESLSLVDGALDRLRSGIEAGNAIVAAG